MWICCGSVCFRFGQDEFERWYFKFKCVAVQTGFRVNVSSIVLPTTALIQSVFRILNFEQHEHLHRVVAQFLLRAPVRAQIGRAHV